MITALDPDLRSASTTSCRPTSSCRPRSTSATRAARSTAKPSRSPAQIWRIGLTYNNGFTDVDLAPEMIRDRIDEVLDESSARHWTSATSRHQERAG